MGDHKYDLHPKTHGSGASRESDLKLDIVFPGYIVPTRYGDVNARPTAKGLSFTLKGYGLAVNQETSSRRTPSQDLEDEARGCEELPYEATWTSLVEVKMSAEVWTNMLDSNPWARAYADGGVVHSVEEFRATCQHGAETKEAFSLEFQENKPLGFEPQRPYFTLRSGGVEQRFAIESPFVQADTDLDADKPSNLRKRLVIELKDGRVLLSKPPADGGVAVPSLSKGVQLVER